MGDGVNIAARLEGVALPGAVCLSDDPYRQVRSRLNSEIRDLGGKQLKNTQPPVRVYSLEVGQPDLGLADFLREGVAQPDGSVQH
jgi:adenylate cyclase